MFLICKNDDELESDIIPKFAHDDYTMNFLQGILLIHFSFSSLF